MKVLIVYAHPEPDSLTGALKDVAVHQLRADGHEVVVSDLYATGCGGSAIPRYGDGILAGKRGMLVVAVGGREPSYSERGINGPIDDLLFPIQHGILYYPAWTCCRPSSRTAPSGWTASASPSWPGSCAAASPGWSRTSPSGTAGRQAATTTAGCGWSRGARCPVPGVSGCMRAVARLVPHYPIVWRKAHGKRCSRHLRAAGQPGRGVLELDRDRLRGFPPAVTSS